jgi:hypothetical protein
MRNANAFVAAMLISLLGAQSAMAAGEACLQRNRIWSTKVIDDSTILITDLKKNQYTVHMSGRCVGLNWAAEDLSFRTKTEIGCLSHGDTISYNQPGETTRIRARHSLQTPCIIDGVTAGAPR